MNNCLKELRIKNGWSQDYVAEKVNISRQTVSLIERKKLTPSVIIAIRIARLFQKNVETIFMLNIT